MDFFESQAQAQRRTKLLVVLFIAAVVSIVLLTNLLFLLVVNYSTTEGVATGGFAYSLEAFLAVSLIVLVFVVGGSVYRVMSLSGGGETVAEMMEGRLLTNAGGDINKRRLLNIVEEMAIASGTPVPPVYIIPDQSINAFAAGYKSGDAVIGITEGAIAQLNREQLQGVIAHEFSHILNGDMRLNIRLMGVLYGILMLAIIGRVLLRSGRIGSSSRSKGGGAIIAAGLGLFVLGYIGQFFGGLIKAAVSRQREFLADASAVQYTRNPEGIGGALKRIGGYEPGSVLESGKAEEISHAFFCQGVKVMFTGLMATHPPLGERIKRIDPGWDGKFLNVSVQSPDEDALVQRFAPSGAATPVSSPASPEMAANPAMAARQVLNTIPAGLAAAAHEPYSARAVVYLLLLDQDELVRSRQLDHLKTGADPFVHARLGELMPLFSEVTPAIRLPLLETAMPALRQLSRDQYERFSDNMEALNRADGRLSLSEWALQKFVRKHLGEAFDKRRSNARHNKLDQLADECTLLLSMLAYSDVKSAVSPEAAFEAGREVLGMNLGLAPKSSLSLSALDKAVDVLSDLNPLRKPRLLKACMATVAADGQIVSVEGELVRAIADSLDCPLPLMKIAASEATP